MLKKRFFKTKAECEVTFELEIENADRVELLCETNDWRPIEMKRGRGGPFRARVRVPRDVQVQFRYLIDRTTWANDDAADAYWTNDFGSENSVISTLATS